MIEYFCSFFASYLFFLLSKMKYNHFTSVLTSKLFLFISAVILIVLGGFRSYSVGTDTLVYKAFFDELPTKFDDFSSQVTIFNESGFTFLEFLLKNLSFQYSVVMLAISSIIVFLYYNTIDKVSKTPVLSFLLLLLLCLFTFHLNAARQGISVAVFFYSLRYIINRRIISFFLCIFFGFLFHKSIILCLPLYFLYRVRFGFTYFLIMICILSVLFSSITSLISFATDNIDLRYVDFSSSVSEATGAGSSLFWIFVFLFLLGCFYFNKINDEIYDFGLYLLTISSTISVLSSFVLHLPGSGILRFIYYFNQLAIILIPIAISSFMSSRLRTFIYSLVIIISLVYLSIHLISLNGLYPYKYRFFE